MGKTKTIKLGNIKIGGGAPVSIQSMTNTDTRDAFTTLSQINTLADAGCEIIRVAIPDRQALEALPEIIEKSSIPVIADIHFDHRLALGAITAGIHGIRINPGNIGHQSKVKEVAESAGAAGVPIRVGANSGSLPAEMYENELKDKSPQDAMVTSLVKSAFQQCQLLEKYGFDQIKVSLKSPNVPVMIKAYRIFASESDYPLHIGVTEAGTIARGTVKSSIGIGALLLDGIGDTLRVSLTAAPVEEIKTALLILETIGLRTAHPEIISCPTCGRTEFDLFSLVDKIEKEIEEIKQSGIKLNINKVAVMGCVVNGPGEAKEAELGIAGVKGGKAALFRNGEMIGTFWILNKICKYPNYLKHIK